ncbi:dual specificity protein phosphatase 22 isoform X1 [Tamandua tetradactyla]|uniref:dual specificity protein phosphatase 22 isoform X1 n=1 Tax=Tamandua tetradactyla TaxID=48850 RepID=UPI0040544E98
MGNGMNKILPGLYIGNFKDARDAEQLSKNKVTHILSVHDSARPLLEGVKYLCIPAADSPSQNLTRHFKESIKFIHECRLQGEGCLVHCLAGVSRSVTLVTAYIMTVTDFGWEDALHTVRAGRSCANPNLGFQRQLQEFEKHEVQQFRQWLKEEYGESPLQDAEEAKNILALHPLSLPLPKELHVAPPALPACVACDYQCCQDIHKTPTTRTSIIILPHGRHSSPTLSTPLKKELPVHVSRHTGELGDES